MNKRRLQVSSSLLCLILVFTIKIQTAIITVTHTGDNGSGSLRSAISAANNNNEDDTIFLQAAVYTLTIQGSGEDQNATGDLDIRSNITIVGTEASGTIIQAGKTFIGDPYDYKEHDSVDRIFHIHPGATVVIRGVTMRYGVAPDGGNVEKGDAGNGESGGGILCQGAHLTLEFCTLHYNRAGHGGGYPGWMGGPKDVNPGIGGNGGGICCENGTVVLNQCTLRHLYAGTGGTLASEDLYRAGAGSGGGIYNTGNLFLNNCTIHTCRAGDGDDGGNGGGVCNWGNMEANNCSFSTNKAGYGFFGGGNGGAIYNDEDGETTIHNCTIYNNRAGSCQHYGHEGSGGGIFNHSAGKVYLRNTIIAANKVDSAGAAKDSDCHGTFVSEDFNLVKNTGGCTFTGETTHNITGLNPKLKALADNGGPTQTHAFHPDSPAVDAGSSGNCTTDQRGYLRPIIIDSNNMVDDGADIGAVEFGSTSAMGSIKTGRDHLYFAALQGGISSSSQTVMVSGTGSSNPDWFISKDSDWIIVTPLSGSGNNSLSVSVNNDGLVIGTYSGTIKIISDYADNSPQNIQVVLNVYGEGQTGVPFGDFSTPIDGSTVDGSIPVTGWALDDIGIQKVQVFREGGTNPVYIGDAVFVEGARPDVAQAFPAYPDSTRAGWGYMMLSNFLPNAGNGTFKILAIATDMEGNKATLGTKVIICENSSATKPFGAIDTPPQGGIASGSNYTNYGWALTPQPNTIPADGSGIIVWVDSIPVGNPVYNLYRGDVAALFPGYNNNQGAGGCFTLDTTQYKNGVHTIAWTATDDAGNTEGIGSRYFSILNTAESKAQSVPGGAPIISRIPADFFGAVEIKKGFNHGQEPETLYPDKKGNITIQIRELQRLEIRFSHPVLHLSPLPIGSFLDSGGGIFYWQPGPGFLGNYRFVFIEKSHGGDENKHRTDVVVVIVPKF